MPDPKPANPAYELPLHFVAEQRAAMLNDLGRYEEALATLRPALASDPHDEGLLVQMAVSLIDLDREAEAIDHLRTAAAAEPNSARVHKLLSLALRHAGDPRAAYLAAVRATQLAPFDANAHTQVAWSSAALRDLDNGRRAADYALRLAPTSHEPHLAMAAVLFPEGTKPPKASLQLAQDHVEQALALSPGNAFALNELARIQMARGRFVSAAGHLAGSVRAAPSIQTMQTNMDLLLVGLVARLHWVLFVVWFIGVQVISASQGRPPWWVLGVLGAAGAVVLATIAWQLARKVPASMRRGFLRGFLRRQRLGAAWGVCLMLTCALFLTAAVVPQPAGLTPFALGGATLVLGAVLSWVRHFRGRRAP